MAISRASRLAAVRTNGQPRSSIPVPATPAVDLEVPLSALPVQMSTAPAAADKLPAAPVRFPNTRLGGPGQITLDNNKSLYVPANNARAGAYVTNQSVGYWLTIVNRNGAKLWTIPPAQCLPIPSNDEFTILNDGTGGSINCNVAFIDYV